MAELIEQLVPGVGLVVVVWLICWLFDRGPAPAEDVWIVEDDDGEPD